MSWDEDHLFESSYRARQRIAPSFDEDPLTWLQRGADLLWLACCVIFAASFLVMAAVL